MVSLHRQLFFDRQFLFYFNAHFNRLWNVVFSMVTNLLFFLLLQFATGCCVKRGGCFFFDDGVGRSRMRMILKMKIMKIIVTNMIPLMMIMEMIPNTRKSNGQLLLKYVESLHLLRLIPNATVNVIIQINHIVIVANN